MSPTRIALPLPQSTDFHDQFPQKVKDKGVLLLEVWLLYCKSKTQEATSKSLNDEHFFFTMAMFKERTHYHIL